MSMEDGVENESARVASNNRGDYSFDCFFSFCFQSGE